jgi:hypothetical protein
VFDNLALNGFSANFELKDMLRIKNADKNGGYRPLADENSHGRMLPLTKWFSCTVLTTNHPWMREVMLRQAIGHFAHKSFLIVLWPIYDIDR